MRTKFVQVTSLSLAAILALAGCETPGQGAKHGAMIGAAAGGLHEGTFEGAVVGAGIGAAAGALGGYIARERRRERYGYYDDIDTTDPRYNRAEYYDARRNYPLGRRCGRAGYVISPYRPYNEIDVREIPSGAAVVDPSTDKVFINP